MVLAALALGLAGIVATFLPQEVLSALGVATPGPLPLLVQLEGALLFGFAMLNWLAKDTLLGGIYGRAVTVGNLAHFVCGGLALLKTAATGGAPVLWLLTVVYVGFALWFALVLFTTPQVPLPATR